MGKQRLENYKAKQVIGRARSPAAFGARRKGGESVNYSVFGAYRGKAGVGYGGSYDGPKRKPVAVELLPEQRIARELARKVTPLPQASVPTLFDACGDNTLPEVMAWPGNWAQSFGTLGHTFNADAFASQYKWNGKAFERVRTKRVVKVPDPKPLPMTRHVPKHKPTGTLPPWESVLVDTRARERDELEVLLLAYNERKTSEAMAVSGHWPC